MRHFPRGNPKLNRRREAGGCCRLSSITAERRSTAEGGTQFKVRVECGGLLPLSPEVARFRSALGAGGEDPFDSILFYSRLAFGELAQSGGHRMGLRLLEYSSKT